MKTRLAMFALSTTLLAAACGETDGSQPVDPVESTETTETSTKRASLDGALPEDGATVSGDFELVALVEDGAEVEARFLLDGAEVATMDEAPYRLQMSACDLTEGNHAYIVEITDQNGNRDFAQQFFWVEGCD